MPGQPDVWPKADAILVAPATFNTINAWAFGITDKWLVGVVAEGIGKRIPVAMVLLASLYASVGVGTNSRSACSS
ncbi:flavoprotein [Streptomyces anulatus]|uniref:flavoprotein n=1 Tax=Streptomyces anulatus TaxID=1892 RepID=UPI002E32335E|nr:flavoprotein [Streptomyces anulatus]